MKTLDLLKPKNPSVVCTSDRLSSIVILDPTVPESDRIAIGIKPDTETYILKNQPDAIEQITKILAKHTEIEALHIITHGSPGTLYLGKIELNNSNIENYSQQLQQWRNALTANASIILYGCEIAAGNTGKKFLTQLHQLTGANIAANSQPTGNSKLGGTWDIPQLIPPSPQKPKLVLTETTLKTYSGILGFATQVTFPTGNGPRSVSIGDINGDGKPDLAVANFYSNTASILLNTTPTNATTPSFATQVTFATGTSPRSVSIGDINGDGRPDLAVANFNSNSASILLNTTATGATTPTFAPQVTFATGTSPISVSIGDINGDGKPDLAVANFYSNTASILLNTTPTGATTPTFATQVTFATGTDPRSVSIGDINGDGRPDLAVANSSNNTASILLNTTPTNATTPSFAPQVTFATGTDPRSVSIGDINGDGRPDLAVVNYRSYSASILLNTTATNATTPTFATQVTFAADFFPISVSIGDINGDGRPDLAVADSGSNSASILLNTTATNATTPSFAPQVTFATGSLPSISVSIGDINGDGRPDLAVANRDSNDASILLNTTAKVTAVTATTPDGSYGVGATINITVTFDSAVTVTGTPRLQLETGTTDQFANYASGSGTTALTFNYLVQPGDTSADLEYLATNALTLNGGTIKDNLTVDAILTLPALASAQSLGGKAIVIETVAPNVALTSTSPPTVTGLFNVTATFNEDVTGFDNTDLTVANATVGNFIKVDAKTYTFNVTPTANGNVTVDVPAAKATDTAGNNNTAANQLIRTANITPPDVTPPNVALTSSSPPTVTGLFNVTATFNEDVTGFDNTDLTVANATVGNFVKVDAKTYTFNVTPTANGNVTVDIPAAKATDTAGNNNTAANQLIRTANITPPDVTPPNVALTSNSPPTVTGLFNVTATFNENVTGFDNTDLTVANATVGNFVKVDAKTYTFDVTPTATGAVTVDVPAAKATDTAGNNNTAATQLTRIADVTPPTANLAAISNITTAGGTSQTLTVTFTDSSGIDVSSLDNSDLVVNWSGGAIPATFISATPTVNGTPRTATYSLTPPGGTWDNADNGTYTVNLQASQVKDTVGNFAAASNLGTFSVDITTPTPTPAPNDDCICDDIAYPNLNQPNEVENTILGVSGIQIGTAKNDELLGSNSGNIFDARSGDDNLYGGDSSDILNGNTGNDFISGGSGDDILFGDENPDIILGNLGNDLIFGGKGNDSINCREDDDIVYGNRNDDFIDGGKGNDTLFGGKGSDVVLGSEGEDSLFGSQGSDTICGGADNDFISGNEQEDLLAGCEGNDTLYGEEDNDTLTGCQGDDRLYGDLGNDSLIGGSGNDVFVLEAGQGFDIIADFTVGQDAIALTGGLSFSQLEITQNTQGTILKNLLTGAELGVIIGVSANLITSANFQQI